MADVNRRAREAVREGLREDHEQLGTLWRDRLVERISLPEHPAWGPGHFRRVAAMSERLALSDEPSADRDVLSAVAWLHDVGTLPDYAQPDVPPPEAAAQAAERILPEIGFPAEKVPMVARIIREHSFDRLPANLSEARVFHDADALDFLGAVGVFRLLAVAGVEDWVPTPKHAIDEARKFARRLPETLVLPTSKRVAAKRNAESEAFLDALDMETQSFRSL